MQPDRAFASDRGGFYGSTLPADHQQRDEAGLREVDVGYRIARLKQDGSLLERDLFSSPGLEVREYREAVPQAGGCPDGLGPLCRPEFAS